jgi:hypothetical protein
MSTVNCGEFLETGGACLIIVATLDFGMRLHTPPMHPES